MRSRSLALAFLVGTVLATGLAYSAPVAYGGAVMRGLADGAFSPGSANGAAAIHEAAEDLGASVVRIDVSWRRAEWRGTLNADYLEATEALVDAARARGLSVVMMVYETPAWASDRTLWESPPKGYDAGRYYIFYPPSLAALDRLGEFSRTLAQRFAGRVASYELWCEPNLWAYLYPQRTANDSSFAVHRYLAMLTAFSTGIRAGDPTAQVVAGATAPMGRNDRYGTSPQRFAKGLKQGGASLLFDVYSHHPYVPGGTRHPAPEAPPADPSTTVSLGNISTLLTVFPDKPFYLSEYGYNTRYSLLFGLYVSQIQQASYLQRAYRLAAGYPQIRLLVWFLIRDRPPNDGDSAMHGIYTGLRTSAGVRKRSWYAFAGGNALTLAAPSVITRDSSLLLRGRLTCASVGGVEGKALVIQRYRKDNGWLPLATVKSGEEGYYHYRLRPRSTATYRVAWRGVVNSPTAIVIVR